MSLSRRAFLIATGVGLATSVQAESKTHDVTISGFAFDPQSLDVTPGDKIRFTNLDLAPHTATANDFSWDTGVLNKGESITLTVLQDWDPSYFCALHPHMTARLRLRS